MNVNLVAKYLSYLRKEHGYTQEELSEILKVSRQAISHWECGASMPDVHILLALSKLYDVTINEILEPEVRSGKIENFEELQRLSEKEVDVIRDYVNAETLVKAYIGTSPENAKWLEMQWKNINFPEERSKVGRIRISDVEDAQKEIISLMNLYLN